jgi:glycosyltransferase involved in cell wall biosynthesis
MLEAMALGIPVVASELPGTRPFLPPECLFAVGDLERAFAILGRLGDPEARRRIADANQRTFAARASGAAFSSAVRALAQRFSGPSLRPVTATDI